MAWIEENNALCASFSFKDFKTAFAFMTAVANAAEAQTHHPEWTNIWNKVHFKLTTHDAGNCITEKDRQLAHTIDQLATAFNKD